MTDKLKVLESSSKTKPVYLRSSQILQPEICCNLKTPQTLAGDMDVTIGRTDLPATYRAHSKGYEYAKASTMGIDRSCPYNGNSTRRNTHNTCNYYEHSEQRSVRFGQRHSSQYC
ncbi:hypothetical protein PS619_00651 [Pseudomonas fluorescens]|nr:hypothetical protein PS619_00651 [Pseudomonas fluorescens]